jgi:hypothetical protein
MESGASKSMSRDCSAPKPINQRWVEQQGENWSHGELVDDGIVKRSVTVEATTPLGR